MIFDITFSAAALAGLLSFLSPCVLPMVPFYLCYMAGISMNELRADTVIQPRTHRKLIAGAILFSMGVTTIFVLLGMGVSVLGGVVGAWKQELAYVAAAFLFVFGLHFLGIIRIPLLYREAKIELNNDAATLFGSYLMGLAFAFGWTPCVGPQLSAILMIAGGMGDVVQGGLLLMVYGMAMTFPFVIAAIFAKPFLRWMQRNRKYMGNVEKVMGVMLIIFAILIATNTVNLIANWMIQTFPIFSTIG